MPDRAAQSPRRQDAPRRRLPHPPTDGMLSAEQPREKARSSRRSARLSRSSRRSACTSGPPPAPPSPSPVAWVAALAAPPPPFGAPAHANAEAPVAAARRRVAAASAIAASECQQCTVPSRAPAQTRDRPTAQRQDSGGHVSRRDRTHDCAVETTAAAPPPAAVRSHKSIPPNSLATHTCLPLPMKSTAVALLPSAHSSRARNRADPSRIKTPSAPVREAGTARARARRMGGAKERHTHCRGLRGVVPMRNIWHRARRGARTCNCAYQFSVGRCGERCHVHTQTNALHPCRPGCRLHGRKLWLPDGKGAVGRSTPHPALRTSAPAIAGRRPNSSPEREHSHHLRAIARDRAETVAAPRIP
eukprot:scaffold16733_cov112-Isochrysis_galbana.AAC.3